jgi:cytochrome c oxidase assembly protein subunit 15
LAILLALIKIVYATPLALFSRIINTLQKRSLMPVQHESLFKGSMILLLIMILGMVVIGGLTRLTGSGLSIVEWKPVTGILPPLSLEGWTQEFSKYQTSPEFQKINRGMILSDFQSIYWLEYIHRLWGRLLGFILLIPSFLMIFKGKHREMWPQLTGLWILGAAQGLMGWLMVKSGLAHDPHVSHYRLAAHLFLGFAIFGVALWTTLSLYKEKLQLERVGFSFKAFKTLGKLSIIALLLVLLTAFMGALVAGLKAGLVYNTFPLMGENLIPHELFTQPPWWKDIFENPVSVQFLHRLLAITTALFCCWIWVYQRHLEIPKALSHAFLCVAAIAILQLSFGVLTLIYQVPIALGVLHQSFAFVLFGSLLYAVFLILNRQND